MTPTTLMRGPDLDLTLPLHGMGKRYAKPSMVSYTIAAWFTTTRGRRVTCWSVIIFWPCTPGATSQLGATASYGEYTSTEEFIIETFIHVDNRMYYMYVFWK